MALEPAYVELTIELDDHNVAHIVRNPVIPWVLPSIEDNFDEASNLPPPPTIVYRNCHSRIPRAGARQAPASAAPSSSSTPTSHYAPSPSSSKEKSHLPPSESCLAAQIEDSVNHDITSSPSPFVPMSPTKDLNPASSSVPMAPLRRIDDPPNPRIWESRRPSSEHFTIYDDPTRREPTYSGLQLPGGSRVQDENQENDCPSEYVSSSEDNAQQNQSLNWNETYFGPRDAFGLPLNLPSVSPSRDNIHPEVNWPTQNGRQVLRPIWVDETEATDDDDWLDENLNETDTFDLDPIESPSPVSPRARTALSRHGGLHGIGPPRSLANSRNNVRRVLNFYADGYRGHTPEADDADDADDEEEEEEEEL